jgi:hypothetical protein
MVNFAFEVAGHAFEPADGDGFFIDPDPAACGFAGPVADAAENAGKNVGLPVYHVGVRESALCNEPDVFGNIRVRGAGPLAIYDLVEVVRIRNICRFHGNNLWRSERFRNDTTRQFMNVYTVPLQAKTKRVL